MDYIRTGTGARTGDNCGEVLGWKYCAEGHECIPMRKHCDKWTCPVCYEGVATRAAERIRSQWKGKVAAYERLWYNIPKVRHYTFSCRADQVYNIKKHSDVGWPARYRKAALRVMQREATGIWGGIVVVHPWRKKHDDNSTCENRACRERHWWVWGPHVHLVGWGNFRRVPRRGSKEEGIYKRRMHGWQYHRITDVGTRDIYGTVRYQLTHGAYVEKQHAYAWVGCMTPARIAVERVDKHWVEECCSHCGSPRYHNTVDPENGEVVPMMCWEKVYIYTYKIRDKPPDCAKKS